MTPSSQSLTSNKLTARDLSILRGERKVFGDVSFDVGSGGVLHIRGPNGSGKTTLLRLVCGLLQPTTGMIEWNGASQRALGDDFASKLAYVGHQNGVKDELSVIENLQFAAKLAGVPDEPSLVTQSLDFFAFTGSEHSPARYLSQGQKRRLSLARLHLSATRPLWVLDEPFAALDSAGIDKARTVIEAHVARGGITLLTTHQDISVVSNSFQRLDLEG